MTERLNFKSAGARRKNRPLRLMDAEPDAPEATPEQWAEAGEQVAAELDALMAETPAA